MLVLLSATVGRFGVSRMRDFKNNFRSVSVNSLLETALATVASLPCNMTKLVMGALHMQPFYEEESQKIYILLPRTIET